MVYKVGKGGVRSGNTLRGLRSLESKRYANQACIVGRTSLAREDVKNLVSSSTDDSSISEALSSTGVILSLNKKQRWRLPATLNHMIKSGYFNKDGAMVSILERHKLKRRANCVSFVCNRGLYGQVKPAQKRYFSFNSDKLAADQSRRMLKRVRAESLRNAKAPKSQPTDPSIKSINVFTVTGSNDQGPLSSSKPEYRLEVFYPCPRSCSLAFNPKYTDVKLEMNEDGKLEMRSNKRASRKTQKHRHRLTNKDIEMYTDDILQDDVGGWDDDYEYLDDNARDEERVTDVRDSESDEGNNDDREDSDNLLNCLITQAEKACALLNEVKLPRRSRKSSKPTESSEIEQRSHIVYTDEVNPRRTPKKIETKKVKVPPEKEVELVHGKVILSDLEICPDHLRATFGQCYAEADCEPRRFVVNVTDDVVNTLLKSRCVKNSPNYVSFLVFTLDGFYDNGLTCCKVLFNSMLCPNTKRIAESLPFQHMTLEGITNQIISTLLDMKLEEKLKINEFPVYHSTVGRDYLQERLKLDVHTYFTSDQINKIQLAEKTDRCAELFNLTNQWEQVSFCEICYSDVTSSHYESSPGTQLNKCGHVFCDSCWRSHFRSKLSSGSVKVTCPGYECSAEVSMITLLSLVNVKDVNLFLQRQCEADIETSMNTKWCPNPKCGRVISVRSIQGGLAPPVDVSCACGLSLCFTCLGNAHWPARCDQAEVYAQTLPTLRPHKEAEDDLDRLPPPPPATESGSDVVEIEGRLCPACNRFINKDGGCSFMVCQCGLNFCWTCMKAISGHASHPCAETVEMKKTYARRILVRHVDLHSARLSSSHQKRKSQRASMYQRALQQKMESTKRASSGQIRALLKRIQHVLQVDPLFKSDVLAACQIDQSSFEKKDVIYLSPHVTKFLKSCIHTKQYLHHVAEFTFVLLQSVPSGLEKQRALKLANDLSAFCSFISSVFETGSVQDPRVALRRLVNIRTWSCRALDILLLTVNSFRSEIIM
ncbi:hypothetical protein Btru_041322 [Bulinus truncatus]|nr:hypothetical protein Btru_041322 [Bulinus truncatus]